MCFILYGLIMTLLISCTKDFPKYSEKYTVFLLEAQEYNRAYSAG